MFSILFSYNCHQPITAKCPIGLNSSKNSLIKNGFLTLNLSKECDSQQTILLKSMKEMLILSRRYSRVNRQKNKPEGKIKRNIA